MKKAETWVVLLQLSRKVGEIDPCNVLVSHGSIRYVGQAERGWIEAALKFDQLLLSKFWVFVFAPDDPCHDWLAID